MLELDVREAVNAHFNYLVVWDEMKFCTDFASH